MNKTIINISPDRRGFVDAQGQPFFWLGDTLWELFRLYTVEEALELLEIRKRQGFSAIQIMFTGVGEGLLPNLQGEMPWVDGDPAHPNEAYFQYADAIIAATRQMGLALVVGVYHQLQVDRITPDKAFTYAQFVAQRYQLEPHLVWSMYPRAEDSYIPVLRELARGLRSGDGGAHLITVHPDPSPTSSSFIHAEPWLDFNSIQTCISYELIDAMVRADYARVPTKPVVMAEGAYEGVEFDQLQTALEIRQQAWWTHMAGGYHSYGHNDNWLAPREWRRWVESPGAASLTVFRDLVTSLPDWQSWVPDQRLIANGHGEGRAFNSAVRASDGSWGLVYLSTPATVTIDLSQLSTGKRARGGLRQSCHRPTGECGRI